MNKGSAANTASTTASAIGFLATVGLAAVLSLRAYRQELPAWLGVGQTDKVLHFALAGTLAFFLDGALRARPAWRGSFAPPLAAVLVIAPVGLEEYLQRYSAVRTSSIWDFAADVGGVTLFIVVARKVVPLLGAAWRQRWAPQPRS
ncbi:hypothetical protein BH11MYX4_BH11MYX4_19860 [soil metagenome]